MKISKVVTTTVNTKEQFTISYYDILNILAERLNLDQSADGVRLSFEVNESDEEFTVILTRFEETEVKADSE